MSTVHALIEALQSHDWLKAFLCVRSGVDVNMQWGGKTALEWMIYSENVQAIEFLFENGAYINVEYALQTVNPLCTAVAKNNVEIVKLLLKHGAQKLINNYSAYDSYTPLIRSVLINKHNMSEILLKNGADPNATDAYGRTALMYACIYHRINSIHTLLEFGANPNVQDRNGMNALHYAVQSDCTPDVINKLIDCKVSVNAQENVQKLTPLMIAITRKNSDVIKILLDAGADMTKQNCYGLDAKTMLTLHHLCSI